MTPEQELLLKLDTSCRFCGKQMAMRNKSLGVKRGEIWSMKCCYCGSSGPATRSAPMALIAGFAGNEQVILQADQEVLQDLVLSLNVPSAEDAVKLSLYQWRNIL